MYFLISDLCRPVLDYQLVAISTYQKTTKVGHLIQGIKTVPSETLSPSYLELNTVSKKFINQKCDYMWLV